MPFLARSALLSQVAALLKVNPVVALLGPRQSGKTTLATSLLATRTGHRFDLEDPRDLRRLEQPMTALEGLKGLVVLDEIQRRPELFPVLRVLADRRPTRARFLILGSTSPELLKQSSETLAGRIRFLELGGLSLEEVGAQNLKKRLSRGGFPRSFLARTDADSFGWREDFIRTFVERDLTTLGFGLRTPANVGRLFSMLAHRHGQLLNGAELSSSLGESYPTVKHHLEVLMGALVVRSLPPWLPNFEKRLVKSHKVFVRDSGLVNALLGSRDWRGVEGHPALGTLWEGLVFEELVRCAGDRNVFFWSTQGGAELDFLVTRGNRLLGFEVKWSDAPSMSKSMHIALSDLGLEQLYVVTPGAERYRLHNKIEIISLQDVTEIVK